jgi:Domain of unknown function (DUF6265)
MSRMLLVAIALLPGLTQVPQDPPPAPAARTANTIGLPADAPRPKATLAAVSWLAGAWRGDGMGGVAEEQWSAPAGGQMMGMFRLLKPGTGGSDAISFYEFLTFVEQEGTLVLKLKHFNADLTGWEEKDEFVTFRLARVTPDAVYFDGLTFRRDAPDRLSIFLALRDSATGTVSEATFRLTRR